MPKVKFIYSRARPIGGGTSQEHELVYETDVPGEQLTYDALATAEATFARWFRATHPGFQLLTWRCEEPSLGRASEYRAFLPVPMK